MTEKKLNHRKAKSPAKLTMVKSRARVYTQTLEVFGLKPQPLFGEHTSG